MAYTPQSWDTGDQVTAAELTDLSGAVVSASSGIADMAIDQSTSHLQVTLADGDLVDAGAVPAASDATVAPILQNTASASYAAAQSAATAVIGPSLMVTASGTDQTAALTSFLAAASPLGVKKVTGSMELSGTVPIPAGVTVDATQATFTQTASNTVSFTLAAGATLDGATVNGKATDYTPGTNVAPAAVGVRVTGAGATVRGATIANHAGAGVQLDSGAANFTCTDTEIHAAALTIPAGDSACFGVYASTGCPSPTLTGVNVHDTSIGIITSVDTSRTMINGCRVHDIHGQHGLYIQNTAGLNVNGLDVWNTNLNGLKCQMFASSPGDATGATIANVTVDNAGDTGLTLNNTDPALTYKYRAVTVSNVTVTNSVRGFYLGSLRTASLRNLVAYNCSGDGITLLDCWDTDVAVNLDTIGQVGARLTSVTNGSNQRIALAGRIRNPANGNVSGNIYGVYVADAQDLTLDGLRVTATNGIMQYGVFFAGGDQASLTVRNCGLSGDTGTSVRLMAGPVRVKEWCNNTLTGNVLYFPTAYAVRIGSGGLTTDYVINALPTADVFRAGDQLRNGAPAVGQPKAWVCTTAGGAHGGTWAASTAYNVGDWRRNSAGRVYSCTVAGTSGTTGPVGTTIGATETDGGVTWKCQALAPAAFTSTGNL